LSEEPPHIGKLDQFFPQCASRNQARFTLLGKKPIPQGT
jgi:hypothetical protein